MDRFEVIGLMSGTSLDGLDLAHCLFEFQNGKWSFDIVYCETIRYPSDWHSNLSSAMNLNEIELRELNKSYGRVLGNEIIQFTKRHNVHPDFISSHGHTVKHQPEKGITLQIGDGETLSATCGIPVINDFRTENVVAGGQGAPWVPIGDLLLFSDYPTCLNLGGIANLSHKSGGKIHAYDIGVCNLAFNYFAEESGLKFDDKGMRGRSGQLEEGLFRDLNKLEYFSMAWPKSLDASFFDKTMLPVLNTYDISIEDKARTCYDHLAFQISSSINSMGPVLVTGGGAHNDFLIDLLRINYQVEMVLADDRLIDFKEALIFAFLGVLRMRGEVNCLASVTGAVKDMCTGKLHGFERTD